MPRVAAASMSDECAYTWDMHQVGHDAVVTDRIRASYRASSATASPAGTYRVTADCEVRYCT